MVVCIDCTRVRLSNDKLEQGQESKVKGRNLKVESQVLRMTQNSVRLLKPPLTFSGLTYHDMQGGRVFVGPAERVALLRDFLGDKRERRGNENLDAEKDAQFNEALCPTK